MTADKILGGERLPAGKQTPEVSPPAAVFSDNKAQVQRVTMAAPEESGSQSLPMGMLVA